LGGEGEYFWDIFGTASQDWVQDQNRGGHREDGLEETLGQKILEGRVTGNETEQIGKNEHMSFS